MASLSLSLTFRTVDIRGEGDRNPTRVLISECEDENSATTKSVESLRRCGIYSLKFQDVKLR